MDTPVCDSQSGTSRHWQDFALVGLLLLSALGLRGWLLLHTEVLARDSIGYIRYALDFEADNWTSVLRNNHQHPSYPLTVLAVSVPVRAWSALPEADAMTLSAQLASGLAAVLLVIPMYFLGKILFNRAAGFGAAILFQCLPVPAHILSDGLSEALFLLLASNALALAALAMRGSKLSLFALSGLFCGLAYLTRPEGALVLAATLIALLGVQLAKVQRRSLGQLLACGASMSFMAAAVGLPYMVVIGGLTNKPSVHQWFGQDISEPNETPLKPGSRIQASVGIRPAGPLVASIFGINLNLQDTASRRGMQAAWGLGGELAKCFHYVAALPVLLGMWWFRARMWTVPGLWVLLVLCLMSTFGLWWLAVEVGYMSDRHLLLIVLCGCYAASAAVWEIPLRWTAWRQASALAAGPDGLPISSRRVAIVGASC